MALAPGTRLGTYEITGPLGAGGMGEVYRARDLRLGRDVAIKVLPEAVASSPERLARLEREARTVAGLNHPNIVTLFSVEDEDGVRFLTMELVEGESLAAWIAAGGLPLSRLLDLAIPLADALVAAHQRGVVHRDLKPGNVMVSRDGRLKVLDFGLAKIAGRAEPARGASLEATMLGSISESRGVLGTVPYMAPEQVRGEDVDARADIFALGIILYELATGRRPFLGASAPEVSAAILHQSPPLLTGVRPDLPGSLHRVVDRCLEKNLQDRTQTAEDVAAELRRMKHAMELGVRLEPGARDAVSIGVLPFVNRSRDEEDEYFSDGLADELINVLARIRGLRVAARTSAFQFKGTREDLEAIGRKLNVTTVLDGSVRKSGQRVRISVQLVRIADGRHLWSETYDRTLDDIFAVQDDIAHSVVKELRTTLLGEEASAADSGQVMAEVGRAARGRAKDPEAHRLYLLGRYFVDQLTREGTVKGIQYVKEAIALEPDFALAWSVLGFAYTREANSGWAPVSESFARARGAIERAIALEPDLSEAIAVLGRIRLIHDWDFRGADASLRRALELEPGNPTVLRMAAETARNLGRFAEAVAVGRRAVEQDPLSASSYSNLGLQLHSAGQSAEAVPAFRRALELAPTRVGTHAGLALALLALGRREEALAESTREPDEAYRLWVLAIVAHAVGRPAESDEALRALTATYGGDSAYQIAEAHAARGEADAAFAWLERAAAQRDGGIITELKGSAAFRAFHADPRWNAFLERIGFDR